MRFGGSPPVLAADRQHRRNVDIKVTPMSEVIIQQANLSLENWSSLQAFWIRESDEKQSLEDVVNPCHAAKTVSTDHVFHVPLSNCTSRFNLYQFLVTV